MNKWKHENNTHKRHQIWHENPRREKLWRMLVLRIKTPIMVTLIKVIFARLLNARIAHCRCAHCPEEEKIHHKKTQLPLYCNVGRNLILTTTSTKQHQKKTIMINHFASQKMDLPFTINFLLKTFLIFYYKWYYLIDLQNRFFKWAKETINHNSKIGFH